MTIDKVLSSITELADDYEKAAAVFSIISQSENEEVIKLASEFWVILILIHGDLINEEYAKVAEHRLNRSDEIQDLEHQIYILKQKLSDFQRHDRYLKETKKSEIKKSELDYERWRRRNELYNKDPSRWV